jgi:hypothetical protein
MSVPVNNRAALRRSCSQQPDPSGHPTFLVALVLRSSKEDEAAECETRARLRRVFPFSGLSIGESLGVLVVLKRSETPEAAARAVTGAIAAVLPRTSVSVLAVGPPDGARADLGLAFRGGIDIASLAEQL